MLHDTIRVLAILALIAVVGCLFIRERRRTRAQTKVCPACMGWGKIGTAACSECGGKGRIPNA